MVGVSVLITVGECVGLVLVGVPVSITVGADVGDTVLGEAVVGVEVGRRVLCGVGFGVCTVGLPV